MSETRFTERAQAALRLAQECSAALGHGYVGSEHLLLGLAREGKGVAAKVLQSAGLEPESLKAAIARMVGVGAPGGAPSQGLTPRCKKIIELSLTEAARLGHHYVGTEHLLLGILREGDGVAVRELSGTGVEPRRLHADVVAANNILRRGQRLRACGELQSTAAVQVNRPSRKRRAGQQQEPIRRDPQAPENA